MARARVMRAERRTILKFGEGVFGSGLEESERWMLDASFWARLELPFYTFEPSIDDRKILASTSRGHRSGEDRLNSCLSILQKQSWRVAEHTPYSEVF